jgi:hypothetical protein
MEQRAVDETEGRKRGRGPLGAKGPCRDRGP